MHLNYVNNKSINFWLNKIIGCKSRSTVNQLQVDSRNQSAIPSLLLETLEPRKDNRKETFSNHLRPKLWSVMDHSGCLHSTVSYIVMGYEKLVFVYMLAPQKWIIPFCLLLFPTLERQAVSLVEWELPVSFFSILLKDMYINLT